jgi:queuine tRNA-ribosyltransferase
VHADLRAESADALKQLGFDGYAIGGLAVGEGQELMFGTLDHAVTHLPAAAPRYLMGVGKPGDIVGAVVRGCDMFDCVLPTRSGRTAQAFTRYGTLNLRNARHADDPAPLDESVDCRASREYSRAYYHHLIRSGELLGLMLLSWHNIAFYQTIMKELREAIASHTLNAYVAKFTADQARGETDPEDAAA